MTVTSPLTHTGHEIAELLAENARLSEAVAGYHKLTEAQREQIERLREALNKLIDAFVPPKVVHIGETCNRYEATYSVKGYDPIKEARAALSETEWSTSISEWVEKQETK